MQIFTIYFSATESLSIVLAPLFFIYFFVTVLIQKICSKENAYTLLNLAHFRIGLLYITILAAIALDLNEVNTNQYIGFLIGVYIYFSLHYVFFLPIIGICKKSISIKIMESILDIEKEKISCTKELLINQMTIKNVGVDDIRENRLDQMIILKLATRLGNHLKITFFGKKMHQICEMILRIWNQKRL